MIIPRPSLVTTHDGELELAPGSRIVAGPGAQRPADLLHSLVGAAIGLERGSDVSAATIQVVLVDQGSMPAEAYRLRVGTEQAVLEAGSVAGLCNGVQTVAQLLPATALRRSRVAGTRFALPALEIEDAPRFSWRGGHLDVSRHFMPASFLFRFVDLLAMHKLNIFHLHLTDDQGWRIAPARYPLLAEVSSWRRSTLVGRPGDPTRPVPELDGTPHGGLYDWDCLRDLVSYAAERNVTVVPEIDLPGHVQAAIAAYPELGCTSERVEVWDRWGISKHVLDISDKSLRFCTDVLAEMLEAFPSKYIHVGGDECPRDQWRESPTVQTRLASLGLGSEDALQSWFTRKLNDYLRSERRTLVGWDEILEGGPLPVGATVMSWRGESGGITAARAGFDVVMCPETPCYLDHYQSEDPDEPLAIGGLNTLEDVYAYDPVPSDLDSEAARHVLGTEFLLWSEYLPDPTAVEYMAFPRAAALAEVAWSNSQRDVVSFRIRIAAHLERLDVLGINYRPLAGPRPWQRGGTGARRRVFRA